MNRKKQARIINYKHELSNTGTKNFRYNTNQERNDSGLLNSYAATKNMESMRKMEV